MIAHHTDRSAPVALPIWRRIFLCSALFLLLTGLVGPALSTLAQSDKPTVLVGHIDGTITPVMARYVDRVLDKAADDEASAVVFEMDTPGGLSSAMDDIIRDILESEVPVVVYVSPRGARAASAGVYITYAAHVAAMAPGTNIGSASPVFIGGDNDKDDTMTKKVTNDAVAQIKNLAALRGRNAGWAEQAVREAVNITADEALQLNVIDDIAPDLKTLLNQIDGRSVAMPNGQTTALATAGAETRDADMNFMERFLQMLADPTIGYLLLSLGMLGVFFELSNPGALVPAIVGGLGILLGLFALGTLPVNWAGVLLMALAFVLFIADLFLPSAGLLTISGLISFVLGSFMLIDSDAPPGYDLSRTTVWTVTICLVSFFGILGFLAVRTRMKRVSTGKEALIGTVGVVRETLDPSGMVFAKGELWSATIDPAAQLSEIPAGTSVVITALDGLRLVVRPASESEQATGASVAVPPWGAPESSTG
jgi:membrane-bound serine protease (ClpP class)